MSLRRRQYDRPKRRQILTEWHCHTPEDMHLLTSFLRIIVAHLQSNPSPPAFNGTAVFSSVFTKDDQSRMLKPKYPLCIFPARFLYIRFSSIILSYVSVFSVCFLSFRFFPPKLCIPSVLNPAALVFRSFLFCWCKLATLQMFCPAFC